jgi:hypothetical protein
MTDQEFLDRFERADLDQFRHADHVRVACLYLDRHDREEALRRIADRLLAFATAKGEPGRFHYTLTRAWLELIDGARRRYSDARTSDALLFVCPALSNPKLVERFYSFTRLQSAGARKDWVGPDLAPLDATLY